MRATLSSGSQTRSHTSLKVPVVRVPSAGVPHGTPRARRRWSSTERARCESVRRSTWIVVAEAVGFSRSERWVAARSAASGTIGVSAGTVPRSSPTTSRLAMTASGRSDPSHSTARVASVSSSSPTDGRPRTAASDSARRTASTTEAGRRRGARLAGCGPRARARTTRRRAGLRRHRARRRRRPRCRRGAGTSRGPRRPRRTRRRRRGGPRSTVPRWPRRGLRQALESPRVGGRRREGRRVEGRGVEGAADDGHGHGLVGEDRPQHLPHRRLAALVVLVAQPRVVAAHLGDRRGEGGEPLDRGVMALLDGVLPPALGVGVAGGPGEHRDRVLPHGRARGSVFGCIVCCLDDRIRALRVGVCPQGEVVASRQVGEPDRDAVPQRPPDRHPLGRERRHRVEARAPRVGDVVDEPGDRRGRPGVGEQRHDPLELGRPLDDNHVRAQRVEGERHRPGRARPVVPHPEDVDRHAQSSSRQAL